MDEFTKDHLMKLSACQSDIYELVRFINEHMMPHKDIKLVYSDGVWFMSGDKYDTLEDILNRFLLYSRMPTIK